MFTKEVPAVALCPHCRLPINPRRCYNIPVDFCAPATLSPMGRVNYFANPHPGGGGNPPSSPLPAQRESGRPSPPMGLPSRPPSPEQPHDADSLSPSSPTRVASPAPSVRGKGKHRSSSTPSIDYFEQFDRLALNSELGVALQGTEALYSPQEETQTSALTSSPSTESSLIPSMSGEPLSIGRRWVVFRGRVPGVYTSSIEATEQTEGFAHAFKLAFDDPKQAYYAYDQFIEDGTIPAHGKGPWVVFKGRKQGVVISFNDLHAAVSGYPNNNYRCCESVEEGQRALDEYLSELPGTSASPPARLPVAEPKTSAPVDHPAPDTPADNSWWCCFAGAEPGVYQGVKNLAKARPVDGGVRLVSSEKEGWKMWTAFLAADRVKVVPS